ncbi:hypothetical protein [Plantibacter sp. YIM 135249]|uniref:hypothetical protein n=1 Tax=Plantibacter sp. YIM 135249 TaxID=3423918 RepID=UPI003D33D550
MTTHRNVVGIDLSLTSTGLAIWDGESVRTSVIKSKTDAGTVESFLDRTAGIASAIENEADLHASDLIVIEGLSMHSKSSSLDKIFGNWWLCLSQLAPQVDSPVVIVTPSQRAMYATGKGNASKDTVLLAVARRYPDVPIKDNNEADALVLAAMGARWLGDPLEGSLPGDHVAAMNKVRWPK